MSEITNLDEIPRHTPSNPYDLTEEQIARRNREVKAAINDFPNIPQFYIEHAWSLIETKKQEELDEMLKAKPKERIIGKGGMTIEEGN